MSGGLFDAPVVLIVLVVLVVVGVCVGRALVRMLAPTRSEQEQDEQDD